MGKKKALVAAVTPKLRCSVTSVDGLARKCARALKLALDLKQDVLHSKRERTPSVSLYFFAAPKVEAEIRGENRPVLPLSTTRWLHVAIDLRSIDKSVWHVHHVSVGVLQGETTSMLKKSVLRAEWQSSEESDTSGHGQPHWHVLGAAGVQDPDLPNFDEIVEASSATQFGAFLGAPQAGHDASSAYAHFHYAMVTDWHVSPSRGPCRSLDDEASLVAWLEGCVCYIRHQLNHVERKAGGTLAAELSQ